MKTRIVNPSLWENDRIAELSKDARIAISFLVNNQKLGLTRYAFITDKYATYSTGLTLGEWQKAKQELQEVGWCYFHVDGWVYQNHDFAYLDYFGRDRVMLSKEEELSKVPADVQEYFKGLIRGYKEVPNLSINHKPKTINNNTNTKYSKLEDITDIDILDISQKYKVPEAFVRSKLDDLSNWILAKGRPGYYKNYYRALADWVKRDSLKIKMEYGKNTSDIALD